MLPPAEPNTNNADNARFVSGAKRIIDVVTWIVQVAFALLLPGGVIGLVTTVPPCVEALWDPVSGIVATILCTLTVEAVMFLVFDLAVFFAVWWARRTMGFPFPCSRRCRRALKRD